MRWALRLAVLPLLALVASAGVGHAEDLEEKSFGLRFTAALGRFSRYPDLAGLGGSGGGSPWSSAPNPASSAMNPAVGPHRLGASAQWGGVFFEEGTQVQVASVSGSYDARRWGSWQPSALVVKSNRAQTSDGLTFEWEAVGGELQWATRLGCDTSAGVNLSVLRSDLSFDLGAAPVSAGRSTTWAARVGVLRRLSRCFCVGVAAEFSSAPSTTTLFDFMGSGTGDIEVRDTTYGISARPGLYALLTKDLSLYADYVFARYEDDSGSLVSHRVSAGLDLTLIRGVYARAGGVLDRWGNVSLTAGVGIAPSERVLIDLSYQLDMFPEIEPEFGRGHVLGIGLSILF